MTSPAQIVSPIVTAVLSREEEYHKKLQKEMKQQDARRFIDPDIIAHAPRIWVAYTRDDDGRQILAGFFRTQRLKLPRIKKIRKKLKLNDHQLLHLVDLFTAAKGVRNGNLVTSSDAHSEGAGTSPQRGQRRGGAKRAARQRRRS